MIFEHPISLKQSEKLWRDDESVEIIIEKLEEKITIDDHSRYPRSSIDPHMRGPLGKEGIDDHTEPQRQQRHEENSPMDTSMVADAGLGNDPYRLLYDISSDHSWSIDKGERFCKMK